jgi:hypothetical protein
MRTPLLAVLAAATLAPAARADDATDAKALVAKAIKAANWPDDTRPQNLTWKDNGTLTAAGIKLPYTAQWAARLPGAYRFEMSAEFMGQKIQMWFVADGDKMWESANGMTREVTGEKKEYSLHQGYQFWVQTLAPLLHDKGFKLSTAGEKDVGGKPAVGVKVERDGKPPITLYFDKATGLMVKSETRVADEFQGWKEVPNEVYYEDWKDVGGRKAFGKFRVVRDGKPLLESTLTDQKRPETLDPKLFQKP